MNDRPRLTPGPDHPIVVAPFDGRVVVTRNGVQLADSRAAVVLREADYPPAYYLPWADVDLGLLESTGHTSYCPFKGDASYHSITGAGDVAENAVWSYQEPFAAVEPIRGRLAFYPDVVQISTT